MYEGIYRFNSKWGREKEKYANSKWMGFDEFVCLRSNVSNFYLKARSENGYGF